MSNYSAVITGTGRALGERRITNDTVARECGISMAELETANKDGYTVRWRAGENVFTSTLMAEAAKNALLRASVKPEDVDLLICATNTPDFTAPPTSARVQHEAGLRNAGFFDLNSTCAGFAMALAAASAMLRRDGGMRHALVAGGNIYSRFLAPDDVAGRLLFSDSAGAVLLSASPEKGRGICASVMRGDGRHWRRWGIFAGGGWKGFSPETLARGYQYVKTVEPYEKGINVRNWPLAARDVIEKAGWRPEEVELGFFNQSRRRNIEAVCAGFGWPLSVSHDTIHKYGYCGSGCVPVAMDDARENGLLKPGRKTIILTSGTGYAISAAALIL
ncbi:MAG: 3-oxoacyl-[acyl-carrier-protein] synthase III C-terminal domain-containing protein [Elusimicrobiales bacterium]